MGEIQGGDVLRDMLETFEERNTRYGKNYLKVGAVLKVLFPEGVKLETEDDFIQFHFLDWIIGKLTRFSADRKHIDSIHDLGVYAAMLTAELMDERDREAQRISMADVVDAAARRRKA